MNNRGWSVFRTNHHTRFRFAFCFLLFAQISYFDEFINNSDKIGTEIKTLQKWIQLENFRIRQGQIFKDVKLMSEKAGKNGCAAAI